MGPTRTATLGAIVAEHIGGHAPELAARWLERLGDLLPLADHDIFPTGSLLNHIPDLIREIGRSLDASEGDISANTFVMHKARELGALRHAQGASAHQLLREYDLLRGILEAFILHEIETCHPPPAWQDVGACMRRLSTATFVVAQITIDTFIEQYSDQLVERGRRLEDFNRMLSHEITQPLGAVQAAVALLRKAPARDSEQSVRQLAVIERGVTRIADLLAAIGRLSGISLGGDPSVQRVSLAHAACEAARRLRDTAAARSVSIDVDPALPDVLIDFGRLDLILTNLLSNAIKYSDPAKAEHVVRVSLNGLNEAEAVVDVSDNGLGMTPEQVQCAFTPFYRAHARRDAELRVEGTGLGLTIVRECVKALGGTIELESTPGEGSRFTLTLPRRPRA